MDPEVVEVPCPNCKITSESSGPGLAHWDCPGCRRSYFLRRCLACGLVNHVGALQGRHQPWDCVWCEEPNTGFTPHGDPAAATIADLAADVTSHGLTFVPMAPERETQPVPVVTAQSAPVVTASEVNDVPALPALPAPKGPMRDCPSNQGAQLPGPVAAGRSRRAARRIAMLAAATAVFVVAAGALAAAGGPGRDGQTGMTGMSRAVSVSAQAVGTVDLQGVPGQLTIVGTEAGRVKLTGRLHWTGHAPVVMTRLDRPSGVLQLSYRCAAASPCTENYRLAVPGRTALALRQPSGHVVLAGLAGPLRITAGHVDISATGLRSPALAATIIAGHLSASFDAPPRHVSIALTSAQATLRLPASVRYVVSSQVASGYIYIGIPQASSAIRAVTAHLSSAELELLPAYPASMSTETRHSRAAASGSSA